MKYIDTLLPCTTETYNSLPDLDTATANLQSKTKDFDRFVASAVKLLEESEFPEGTLGAFLLHRHWELKAGMTMVERPRALMSGKIAPVTHQQGTADALASGVAPSRWASDTEAPIWSRLSTLPIRLLTRLLHCCAMIRNFASASLFCFTNRRAGKTVGRVDQVVAAAVVSPKLTQTVTGQGKQSGRWRQIASP